MKDVPTGDDLAEAIVQACDEARGLLDEYAQVEMHCERHVENNPHPGGQEAFLIRARLPWHPRPDIPIKVEITADEQIAWPVERRRVIHDYGEPLEAELQVYSPTEVVAEKLRATRQQLARLENRGWMRNPESTEAMGRGVDTRDDGQGKANGASPIPIDGDEGGVR